MCPTRVPALVSGGIMLSYRCSSSCRHCLYRCSPRQPDDWLTPELAGRVFAVLQGEKRLVGIHLAGGEPTLRLDLLCEIVRLAASMAIPVDYLETNAGWCRDPAETRRRLERLRDAGLPALLISVSLFHNEFVPFRNTRTCREAAEAVFGPDRVILYLPQIYTLLARLPGDGTHRLEEVARLLGLGPDDPRLVRMYGVIPNGRACEALRNCFGIQPLQSFQGQACATELTSTTHFHIDPYGSLFTGLCAGLAVATIDELHPELTERSHPVFLRLCRAGPLALAEWAAQTAGFGFRAAGYVSKCDLCLDVREHLQRLGRYPELRPAAFYTQH